MQKDSWLIVANSSLARIFSIETLQVLRELHVLEHPESRMRNLDLVSDLPGRDFESANTARHALEPKTYPKQLEFALFAKMIAEYLEQARQEGKFSHLYIAAAPALLGLLRDSLSPHTRKTVQGESDKDVTQLRTDAIPSHLPFFF